MESLKSKQIYLRNEILDKLTQAGILDFLVIEVISSVNYLNYYKTKSIYDRIDELIKELKEIQKDYIEDLVA